jgi:hypothetical protein
VHGIAQTRAAHRTAKLIGAGAAAALVAAAGPAVASMHATAVNRACTGSPGHVLSTSKVLGLQGLYTVPKKAPRAIIVFAHGYRSWSGAWKRALVQAATRHDAIAVAVDYRGLEPADQHYGGWPTKAGSQDLVKAASVFRHMCSSVRTTVLFSVGMGGDAAGLAVAHAGSRPAFDYWVDAEGATDLYDLWGSLSAFGGPCLPSGECLPGMDTYYAVVRSDLENAAGGPPYEATSGFAALDAFTQIAQASSLRLKGAAVVHAVADGSVLYTEAAEMAGALRKVGVPTDSYTVTRGNGGPDQTIAGDTNSYTGAGGKDPMAGYEPDGAVGDETIKTALSAVWGMAAGKAKPSNQQHVVDGQTGQLP